MAYVGRAPWHGLGQELTRDATIETWRREAGMEWEARRSPVEYMGMDGERLFVPGRDILFRSDTNDPLGVVSSSYRVVQPGEVLEFYRDLVGAIGGFRLETAGCLRGGANVWALAVADEGLTLPGDDAVNRYLLLTTSYDGSSRTVVQQTSIRVVCMNTLHLSLNGANVHGERLTVSHRTTFDGERIKRDMGLDRQWERFAETCNRMTEVEIDPPQADRIVREEFYPDEPTSAAAHRFADLVLEARRRAPGATMDSARGTAWGLVNAVTYTLDHEGRFRSQDSQVRNIWYGKKATQKHNFFRHLGERMEYMVNGFDR
jgi:phage/plasmid-like protein (TIGR03299 family)